MTFSKMTDYVDAILQNMNLDEKVLLFRDKLNCPVDIKFKKYYYLGEEYSEQRMKDLIAINQNWLSATQYDKLYKHFLNISQLFIV